MGLICGGGGIYWVFYGTAILDIPSFINLMGNEVNGTLSSVWLGRI